MTILDASHGRAATWVRRGALVSLVTLALATAGCQHASSAPAQAAAPTATAAPANKALPPLATVSLPPSPVPATFDVAALAEKVTPTVVNITATQASGARESEGGDPFEFFFGPNGPHGQQQGQRRAQKRQALGTGFIIDPSGYVVTNAHVVFDSTEVKVKLSDDREFKAEVVGRDPRLDIALLKLEGAKDLPAAPLGVSDPLRVGEHVLAVGNPFGLGHTVTLGIVSAKARSIGAGPYDDFIQTDASINPGNSGGPLFNWRGEVVGINTAIRAGANGIGFAIPIDEAKDVLPQLRQKGRVDRGKLGIGFQPVSVDLATALGLDSARGALVSEVMPNGAGARAGIHAGDVVLAVNGVPIRHAEELPRRVATNQPGTKIDITLVRDKHQRDVAATLDTLSDDDDGADHSQGAAPKRAPALQSDKIGVTFSDNPNGGGALVEDVSDGSPVRDLVPGDVVVEMNGAKIADVASLRAALSRAKPGSTALVKVRRGKATQFAAIPVPGA